MRASRQSAGFTLLEMLVVLVIIGLIASLVGPRLFSRVDSSKVQVAETQSRLLRGAVEQARARRPAGMVEGAREGGWHRQFRSVVGRSSRPTVGPTGGGG